MRCLYCNSDQSKVIDKREVKGSGEVRRRRECLKCRRRFTTYERVFVEELMILKRDGRKEAFSRSKLCNGLSKALEKRPGFDRIDTIADKIERNLRSRGKNQIQSQIIGRAVLSELKKIDKVAYMRFASVYRNFNQIDDFARELQSLG